MKSIKTIHLFLLAGQLLFGVVVIYLATMYFPSNPEKFGQSSLLGPLLCVSTIVIAYMLNQMRLKQAKTITHPQVQLAHYRNSVLLRSAIIESGNLFLLIFLLIDVFNLLYLSFFVLGLFVFVLFRPSEKEFKEWYE